MAILRHPIETESKNSATQIYATKPSKQTANFFSTAQGQKSSLDPLCTDHFWTVSQDSLEIELDFTCKMCPSALEAAKRALSLVSIMLAAQYGLDVSLNRGSPEHRVT